MKSGLDTMPLFLIDDLLIDIFLFFQLYLPQYWCLDASRNPTEDKVAQEYLTKIMMSQLMLKKFSR